MMDASVRFTGDQVAEVYDVLLRNGGFYMFTGSKVWSYIHIHPNVHRIFPTDSTKQRVIVAMASTVYIMHLTREIYCNIAHWYFLCALDQDCIPKGAQKYFPKSERGVCQDFHFLNAPEGAISRSQCHAYEQAALNVLATNTYGYDLEAFSPGQTGVGDVLVLRHPTNRYNIKMCL